MRNRNKLLSRLVLATGAIFTLSGLIPLARRVFADDLPQVRINADQITPRQLEQGTGESLVREYATAWKNRSTALDQNRTDVLNDSFVGTARERIEAQIAAQRKTGLHERIVDHGHQVNAIFYSIDGSAIQLRDTAQIETQVLDGNTVVAATTKPVNYVTLMTVADGRWKVRELIEVPEFTSGR